jgi:endoglucanase
MNPRFLSTVYSVVGNACVNSKLFSTLLNILSGVTLLACVAAVNAAVPVVTTQGNKVLFGGKVGSVAGNSMFWSNNGWGGDRYYNAGAISWLRSDWKSNLVRAAMGIQDDGGYIEDPAGNKAKVIAVVNAAIANDMYVLIDWHSHHAEQHPNEAIAFFKEMAQIYKNTPNVIFEIYNEPWDDVQWTSTIKPYAVNVINAIRSTGANNLIIVGTRAWSQRVDEAANDPIIGFSNIAYTLHFYVGMHGQDLRDKAQYALNKGIPLVITEWGVWGSCIGCVDYSEANAWKNFMLSNHLSSAVWGLTDKYEESSLITTGASTSGGWTSNQLTAPGTFAKDMIANWPPIAPACTSVAIPGTFQVENYCDMSGIKTETTVDTNGGQNVGYIDLGDWMTYEIDVPVSGPYAVAYRVASLIGGGIIQLEKQGGSPVYATQNVPATGGWQTWVTVTQIVQLPAGKQTLAISAKAGGFNLNWVKIEPSGGGSSSSKSSSSAKSSSSSIDNTITIQAEDFAIMSGVQVEATADAGGGSNVGYLDAGDWMSYTGASVTIPATGAYNVEFRVASQNSGTGFTFEEAGGSPSYAIVQVPNTGGWQTWTTVKSTVTLTSGTHRFGIKANSGGWNINWFRITK